jgi:hypothetical protein
MNSIEKLELWIKAELDDVPAEKWPAISAEINALLSGCSAEDIVNLSPNPRSKMLDNLIIQSEFNDLFNLSK